MSKVRYEKDESLLLTVTFFINLNSVANRNSSPSPYLILFRYIRFPLILISFSVFTWASSCDYPPKNQCEQKERIKWRLGPPPCLTTRLCLKNECRNCHTKHEKNFDWACQDHERDRSNLDWKNYKCCAFNTTKCTIPTGPSIWQ